MTQSIKAFNIRLPKDIWIFLKKMAAEQEKSMTEIISTCLTKYKEKCEKKVDIE